MKQWKTYLPLSLVLASALSFIACDSSELRTRNLRNRSTNSNSADVSQTTGNCAAQAGGDAVNCDPVNTTGDATGAQSNISGTPEPAGSTTADQLATGTHSEDNTSSQIKVNAENNNNNDDDETDDNSENDDSSENDENSENSEGSENSEDSDTDENSETNTHADSSDDTDGASTSETSDSRDSTFVMKLASSETEKLRAVVATPDGGFVAVGSSYDPASMYTVTRIVKMDAYGTIIWTRKVKGLGIVYFILRTRDDNLIVVSKDRMSKLTSAGAFLWQRSFAGKGVLLTSVRESKDGGLIVCGDSKNDALLAKFDRNGKLLWSKKFNVGTSSVFSAVIETENGGFIAVGKTDLPTFHHDELLIVRISNSGTIAWKKIFGRQYLDSLSAIVQTTDGDYVVAGRSAKAGALLIKLKGSGEFIWTRAYKEASIVAFNDLVASAAGGVVVVGYGSTSMKSGRPELSRSIGVVLNIDASGSNRWARAIEGPNDKGEMFSGISATKNGNFIISGEVTVMATATLSRQQGLLVSINAKGNLGERGSRWFSSYNSFAAKVASTNVLEEGDDAVTVSDITLEVDASLNNVTEIEAEPVQPTFIP